MVDFLSKFWVYIFGLLSSGGFFWGVLRCAKNRIFEVEIYDSPHDTYAYVLDSQRNFEEKAISYSIHVKVTLNFCLGSALNINYYFIMIKDDGEYFLVDRPDSLAPKNVWDHFGENGLGKIKEKKSDSSNVEKWTYKGVAVKYGSAFNYLNSGGYQALVVLVFDRFVVTVPMRLATFRDQTNSIISGGVNFIKRKGGSIDPEKIARDNVECHSKADGYSRFRFCILDFDFLPFISWLHPIKLKGDRLK
ncbi:hypothetical protein L6172_11360 [Thalassospiraceae bacterium SW-3-3]|nr:hypothetical protein L6172_11360 [Thalassospiraceae bacterium SW-3-3]